MNGMPLFPISSTLPMGETEAWLGSSGKFIVQADLNQKFSDSQLSLLDKYKIKTYKSIYADRK